MNTPSNHRIASSAVCLSFNYCLPAPQSLAGRIRQEIFDRPSYNKKKPQQKAKASAGAQSQAA